MRVFQQVGVRLLSNKGYIALKPCAQIASDGVLSAAAIVEHFPSCAAYFSGENMGQTVVVQANYSGLPIEINVALSFAAGASAFAALIVHIFGAELYVREQPLPSSVPSLSQIPIKAWGGVHMRKIQEHACVLCAVS